MNCAIPVQDLVVLIGGLERTHPAVHCIMSGSTERHTAAAKGCTVSCLGVFADADAGVAFVPEIVVMSCPTLSLFNWHIDIRIEHCPGPDFRTESARHVRAFDRIAFRIAISAAAEPADMRRIQRKSMRRTVTDALQTTVADRLIHQLMRRLQRRGGRPEQR